MQNLGLLGLLEQELFWLNKAKKKKKVCLTNPRA